MAATLIFGAWPSWTLTGRAVVSDLKRQTGEEGRRARGLRIGNALVMAQVALLLLLIATGGLFLMSAVSAATPTRAFESDGALVAEDRSGSGRVRRSAGKASASRVDGSPANGSGRGSRDHRIASGVRGSGESRDVAPAGAVDARDYSDGAAFSVVGRDYARSRSACPCSPAGISPTPNWCPGSSERVAIIDDVLAQRLWPGEDALGRLIQFLDDEGRQNAASRCG